VKEGERKCEVGKEGRRERNDEEIKKKNKSQDFMIKLPKLLYVTKYFGFLWLSSRKYLYSFFTMLQLFLSLVND
jgi:hypothetical protein